MRFKTVWIAAAAAVGAFSIATAPAGAQSFSGPQRDEIQKIIRNYIVQHPEVLQEAMAELEKRQQTADSEKAQAAVKTHSQALFFSPHQVVVGNAEGDVTLVEFFDYNCGYCKRALTDLVSIMKEDPKLRVVLKEFPVLGPTSIEVAQVAIAVRMQDPSGKKYFDFHQRLLNGRGQIDKAKALAVAKEVGLDTAQVEKDMTSGEVRASIEESFKLAEALGLNGTPSYVVGQNVVVGAVGVSTLKEKIAEARK